MSRLIRVFDVFVSSPGDVREEREQLKKIVIGINRVFLRRHGILLNLLFWETDIQSAKGSDLQDVINQQVGDNYDVYLGIIWSRIGSETPRASSGTVEEFQRALDRYNSGEENLRIMFFVRTGGYPDTTNPKQLEDVQRFRQRLSNEGVLAKTYATIEEFSSLAYDHLQDYLDQQIATAHSYTKTRTKDPLARALTLLPDFGRHLVQGALDLMSLSQAGKKGEVQSLLGDLKADLTRMEDVITDIEKQGRLDRADLARDIVFGDGVSRAAMAKRIAGSLSEVREAQELFIKWHQSLLKLASQPDLDGLFMAHLREVISVADHLIVVVAEKDEDLSKLERLALRFPDLSSG